ncbi:MAG: oligosaccharide flippase family protein [Candidatus Euphemobacter frigidus]|nr:oligosaccharide flippase family protein [Candidatus Euphemobacter frigidus]MDP8275312.1 oligosaccharide flippase family protein [Candidatus Euphemobacter frigidus]
MRKKITRLIQNDFIRHTGIMVLGTGLVNIFNLVYQLGLVRLLSVVEYGVLNSLISLTVLASQFTVPFYPVLARSFSIYIARNESGRVRILLKRATRDLGIIAAILLLILILASGPIATWLQIGQSYYIILVGFVISASTLAVVPGAFLWGWQRFTHLAALGILPAGLKLAVGLALVGAGLGVSGALGGYVTVPLCMILVGFTFIHFLRRDFPEEEEAGDKECVSMASIYKYFIPTGIALFSFSVLTNFDVILVKHFFPPREAGFYSVAQMVGKIILFLPGAISIVIFPKAASAQARSQASFSILRKGLVVVASVNVVAMLVCAVFPGFVLKILTGKTDPESVRLVPWFALAMSFYALTWLNIFYHLSIHSTRFIPYLAGFALAQTVIIAAYHPGLKSVLIILTIFSIFSFIVTLALSRSGPLPSRPIEEIR